MNTTLKQVESMYRLEIEKQIHGASTISPETLIGLAIKLFHEFKIKGISDYENPDYDMLLFQYGIYRWGKDAPEQFEFNITRQFIAPEEDEPFQLSLTLDFDPNAFREINAFNCWSMDFPSIEDFAAHIHTTQGFLAAKDITPLSFDISFGQC